MLVHGNYTYFKFHIPMERNHLKSEWNINITIS